MATSSGTTVFEKTFTIDEIIEESYERIGLVNNTGNQMKAATTLAEHYVSRVV
jgi:hypothetical protein